MAIRTILELELNGRGQGWTDVSSDLTRSSIVIQHGINGNGVSDLVAATGSAKFGLVNQDPEGKYSFRHPNRLAGFALGIGVRFRLRLDTPQGDGAGYAVNNAGGYPAGTTTIDVDGGSGVVARGDVVTFAGVAGEYVVASSTGDPATSVEVSPGLLGAVADDAALTSVGRSFTRHRGRLDSASPAPGVYGERTVACESVDWMDDAARTKMSQIPVQVNKRPDEVFQTLVDAVPFAPDAVEADESPDVFGWSLDSAEDESSFVLSELQKIAQSERGLIYQKADGTVVFESRNRRAVSETIVDTFTDVSALTGLSVPVARDDAISRVQVVAHPRKVDELDDTELFRLDNPVEVGPSVSQMIIAPYRDPSSEAERVGGVDMRTPVAGVDYTANTSADGTGTDVTAFVTLAIVFGGNGAEVTIENASATTVWLTSLVLKGRGIYDYQNVVLEARDATAEVNVGTSASADLPYQADAALANEIALWLINLYKDPETLAQSAAVVVPRTDEVLAARVLGREISDRIGIVEQVTGHAVDASGGHFIQSVKLSIDERDNLSVEWVLAPANRQLFWLLEVPGRSELDFTTVLGFGRVVGHTDVLHCDSHDDADHGDTPHTDTHDDVHDDFAHNDSTHTDSHDDDPHEDIAHDDEHSDQPHADTSHRDSHSDVGHADSHDDTAHTDDHGDVDHNDHEDHVDGV